MKKTLITFGLVTLTLLCLAALPTTLNYSQFQTAGPLTITNGALVTNLNSKVSLTTGTNKVDLGTAANPSFTFTIDNDTGIFRSSTNALGFATAGVERFVLNASGSLVPILDNTYDIGNGASNPRDIQATRVLISGRPSTVTGTVRLYNAAGTTFQDFQAGNSASTITNVWPADVPANGEVLKVTSVTGGTATLEWGAAGGGSQNFDSNFFATNASSQITLTNRITDNITADVTLTAADRYVVLTNGTYVVTLPVAVTNGHPVHFTFIGSTEPSGHVITNTIGNILYVSGGNAPSLDLGDQGSGASVTLVKRGTNWVSFGLTLTSP